MKDTVIRVENLSKQYRLGMVGTGTLSHDLKRWWYSVRGKEDPFLKVGEANKRDVKGEGDYVWALRNINFEVKRGEVLGIIGKNGAGKSTLLKILSRITSPTTGEFKVKGRIASLLEVGTGFHPELTGRENIFLNGAILGMTKTEIRSKFDEIVAFSGVERYIDTPVKRYSSGMYVRLAFAVAAHLEPEILIIDEVLAVGDAEFQKKCLGKMKDVAGQGRTVLFVSHNMTAVKSLCPNSILIKQGEIVKTGTSADVIDAYLNDERQVDFEKEWKLNDAPGNDKVRMLKAKVSSPGSKQTDTLTVESEIELEFIFQNLTQLNNINLSTYFCGLDDFVIFATTSKVVESSNGLLKFTCRVPARFLNAMMYKIDVLYVSDSSVVHSFTHCLQLEIEETERKGSYWFGKWPGVIRPSLNWQETEIKEQNLTMKKAENA